MEIQVSNVHFFFSTSISANSEGIRKGFIATWQITLFPNNLFSLLVLSLLCSVYSAIIALHFSSV